MLGFEDFKGLIQNAVLRIFFYCVLMDVTKTLGAFLIQFGAIKEHERIPSLDFIARFDQHFLDDHRVIIIEGLAFCFGSPKKRRIAPPHEIVLQPKTGCKSQCPNEV